MNCKTCNGIGSINVPIKPVIVAEHNENETVSVDVQDFYTEEPCPTCKGEEK